MSNYPKEVLYSIEGTEALELSLTIGKNIESESFWVESLILFKETKKIFKNLGRKYEISDEESALSEGLRTFRLFRNL